MSSMMHSRKFWLAVLDAAVTIGVLWVNTLLPEARAEVVVATIVALQVPFAVLINGIAKEDAAALQAGTHPSQKE
jgi:hypothetical protein